MAVNAVMKTVIVVVLLMLVQGVTGQNATEIVIPGRTILSDVLTPEKIYQHPQFTLGKVLYRNGTETEALLNYNNLSGSIEFIGPKKDTLVISKDQIVTIKKIIVDSHTYLYQDGYFEQVEEKPFGKLLKRQMYMVANRERLGAYGQYSAISAIRSYNNAIDNSGGFSRSLTVNEKVVIVLQVEYFFGDKNDKFLPATEKNLMRLYPLKRDEIKDYLEQHKVDFKNIEALKQLFSSL